jgi:hypothetical protein
MPVAPLYGSCLCRGITYEILEPLSGVVNCHCSMCRKAHGAAFRTRATVKVVAFQFKSGEDLLTFYESSPGEHRSFCRVCGANLITRFDRHPEVYGFALGTLDTDPEVKPVRNVFTRFKAPWFDITDSLPQVQEIPPDVLEKGKGRQA